MFEAVQESLPVDVQFFPLLWQISKLKGKIKR